MTEELTDKNYNKIIENTETPIFIDFYSPTCGPCQILLSIIDDITKYGNDNGVKVIKCNIASNPKISNKYQIRSVPMTLIVDKDKNLKDVENGVKDKAYYFNLIDKYNPNKKSFFQKLFNK